MYRDALNDYFDRACAKGGQTPHILREALSWHWQLSKKQAICLTAQAEAKSA